MTQIEPVLCVVDTCGEVMTSHIEVLKSGEGDFLRKSLLTFSLTSYACFSMMNTVCDWDEDDVGFLADQAGVFFWESLFAPHSTRKINAEDAQNLRQLVQSEVRNLWDLIADYMSFGLEDYKNPKKIDAQLMSMMEDSSSVLKDYLRIDNDLEYRRFTIHMVVVFKEAYFKGAKIAIVAQR